MLVWMIHAAQLSECIVNFLSCRLINTGKQAFISIRQSAIPRPFHKADVETICQAAGVGAFQAAEQQQRTRLNEQICSADVLHPNNNNIGDDDDDMLDLSSLMWKCTSS